MICYSNYLILGLNQISSKLPGRGIIGHTFRAESQRLNNGQEDTTGPRRRARHSRRNRELAQNQTVRQTQCTLPKPPYEDHGDPIAEPRLHEPLGEEERHHDKPYHLVREGGEGGGEGEGLGDDGEREADEGPGGDGEGAEDQADDGGDEYGEEGPGLGRDGGGFGDGEAEDQAEGDAEEQGERSDTVPFDFREATAAIGSGGGGGGIVRWWG